MTKACYKIWLKDKKEFLSDSIHIYEFNSEDSAQAFINVYELKNVEIVYQGCKGDKRK